MNRKRYRGAVVSLALLVLASAFAARADFEAGEKAWAAGDTAEALAQWRAAAEEGDRRAMLMLGRLHAQGLGVLQDYVEAHKWLNLAASRGEAAAPGERDAVAANMTPEQIAQAQEAARSWRPGGGADSGTGSSPPASTAAPAAIPPPPPEAIREAQRLLGALGYQPGPADGKWGARSASAYQSFLSDAGLPAIEQLTPDALRTMRQRAEERGVSAQAAPPASTPALPKDALPRLVQAGDVDGVRQLLAAGADLNALDARGWTGLMHAADQGYPVLVDILLAAKPDLDARNPRGATALFIAVAKGHAGIVSSLLRAGADPSIPGDGGKTPAEVARAAGLDAAVVQLLSVFRDCDVCPEMVVVPGGTFRMGGAHEVTVARFAVGRYEVTFAEWDACRAAGGCSHNPETGWGRGNRPVIRVSWDDAKEYAAWLSRETGETYRLLSESEWEYAARAGTDTAYHWGDEVGFGNANCDGCGSRWDNEQTAPVGSFTANAFGLHDMSGNVWEWVEDCWHDSYRGAPSDGRAWTSGGDCGERVLRGGSWYYGPEFVRSADRFAAGYGTGNRDSYSGFRIARTLP